MNNPHCFILWIYGVQDTNKIEKKRHIFGMYCSKILAMERAEMLHQRIAKQPPLLWTGPLAGDIEAKNRFNCYQITGHYILHTLPPNENGKTSDATTLTPPNPPSHQKEIALTGVQDGNQAGQHDGGVRETSPTEHSGSRQERGRQAANEALLREGGS